MKRRRRLRTVFGKDGQGGYGNESHPELFTVDPQLVSIQPRRNRPTWRLPGNWAFTLIWLRRRPTALGRLLLARDLCFARHSCVDSPSTNMSLTTERALLPAFAPTMRSRYSCTGPKRRERMSRKRQTADRIERLSSTRTLGRAIGGCKYTCRLFTSLQNGHSRTA